ncbi:hypothetical protein OBBRIDRAFT_798052 [Obba rivulosa]|uniref:Zn(2)-C6 fungal-type domain-containing protein n=1 Tax=Obba rivulosa TaxID=1052685 RepID=A0A8E2ARV6_9APHY|nr:hypothetical protein OBBRIDRAFT_798052 [Obba rivulosa]
MGATPSSYGETNEVSLGSLAYSDASAPPPTTPSSQPHMYAVGPDLTPDFLTTEHGIYDQPGREHGVASTSAVSCMQDEFEAVWAFLASNAEALESLLGASAGGHASFITLPTTPATQDDAGEDDYPEDADDHGSPENTSDHYGPGDAHGHHDPRDAAASGAPGPMSQYELGVDLADDGSDRWLSADDCMVVLLLACTRCNARKTKCDEWDVNGCGKCRASGAGCVPRIGDPIVKVRQACLQCRRKKTKCDSRMSAQGKRSICSPCKNREGSCCMYRVDLQEQ